MSDGKQRVAVVTGANKGIGFAIVRGLCKQFQGDVFLTARNEELGKQAVAELNKEGLNPKFHQLDVCYKESINNLKTFLKTHYGGLDVLVNNAGMSYKASSTAPFSEQAEVTIRTNFSGMLDVCEELFPLLRPQARVVNLSSMASGFSLSKCSESRQKIFTDKNLTMDVLKAQMAEFVSLAQSGKHTEGGFSNSAYGMSKVGVTCMSIIQQREINAEDNRPDIVINACCPGFVNTDLTSHKGHKSIDEGADTPIYLATLPPGMTSPKGNYVTNRQIKPWQPASPPRGCPV